MQLINVSKATNYYQSFLIPITFRYFTIDYVSILRLYRIRFSLAYSLFRILYIILFFAAFFVNFKVILIFLIDIVFFFLIMAPVEVSFIKDLGKVQIIVQKTFCVLKKNKIQIYNRLNFYHYCINFLIELKIMSKKSFLNSLNKKPIKGDSFTSENS